jgi:hypothetical protein
VTAAEKAIFPSYVTIVGTVGYAAGSDVPIFNKTYSLAGTNGVSAQTLPGEVCALGRWSTTARTGKNHPIYLFSYWHGVESSSGANRETLNGTQQASMNTYGANWVTGFSDGTLTLVRAGPNGATGTGYVTEGTLTHRDFPRA